MADRRPYRIMSTNTPKWLLWGRIIMIVLFIKSPQLMAQEYPGAWMGDTDAYQYHGGILSYRDNGKAGKATISLKYNLPNSGTVVWDFGTQFTTPPTSQNTFRLRLFTIIQDNQSHKYLIEPSTTAKELRLIKAITQRNHNEWIEVSQEVLDIHKFAFAITAWDGLQIRLIYDQNSNGLIMQSFSPHGDLITSKEIIEVETGTPKWEMILSTRFTAKKKLNYSFLLPSVKGESENSDDIPLKIIDSEVDPLGKIVLKVNKPVNATNALVECQGYNPTITNGTSADLLIIQLGETFKPNIEYHFTITQLYNLQGGEEQVEFTIIGTEEAEDETEIPQGIFITEVMIDPPSSGSLRDTKYIELYNNSGTDIDLGSLLLYYKSSKYQLPHVRWRQGTFAILYPEPTPHPTDNALLIPMASFPAFSGSFSLKITDPEGNQLDQLSYSSRLYGKGYPKGLASLERVAYHPDIWRRSESPNGGTPGFYTTMKPHVSVEQQSIVINELMLSPGGVGEKYIELYNRSSTPIDLSHIYLMFANKEESTSYKSWLLVQKSYILSPNAYIVLCPFVESLSKTFSHHDPDTFEERIDFPTISPTYSEIELRSHYDDSLIDKVIYRRQWLGDRSKDRIGHSLERISPDLDGSQRSSWRRAKSEINNEKVGGTPGVRNSVYGLGPDHSHDGNISAWPEETQITEIEELYKMLQSYAPLSEMEVFAIDGTPLFTAQGSGVREQLNYIRQGKAPYPTMLMVVRVTFTDEEREPATITYESVWLHHIR